MSNPTKKRDLEIEVLADDEPRTIDDLRVLVREIKKFWMMGDNEVIADAERVLVQCLHRSAKRLTKNSSDN